MNKKDISSESWRRYEWVIPETKEIRRHLIVDPLALYYEKGGSCHVVTARDGSDIVAHCVPAVGRYGCVLTWGGEKMMGKIQCYS